MIELSCANPKVITDEFACALFWCSDGTSLSYDQHNCDFCRFSTVTRAAVDVNGGISDPSMCEREVSEKCPSGWVYYADFDNSEGFPSCIWVSNPSSGLVDANFAQTACPNGTHLLTARGNADSGLLKFATSLIGTYGAWIGW